MKMPHKLFTPIKIGSIEVKNRIVMPAMGTTYAGPDFKVTDRHLTWYQTRAKGGAGLIIVEITAVAEGGQPGPNTLGIWNDSFIPGFRKLTEAVHSSGAKIFLQLCHAGRQTCREFTGGRLPVAPSSIPCPTYEPVVHEIPHELNIEEIGEIVKQFGQAAGRTREAGFDGLEIHGAHGYLIAGFMSAYSNKRHDAYGGDLLSRLRFAIEVIKSVRRAVGEDFPVGFRLSGDEHVPDGRTIEESQRVAPILEAAGVDCLHISSGVYESRWAISPVYGSREGLHAADAAAIKKVVRIPVITVGRIKSPDVAEEILEKGQADMVAIGRQLICDPDWPVKVARGSFEEIRPCIGCTQGCMKKGEPVGCIYNTSAGMENESEIRPAGTPKKVLVIGGGPGGLEAARVAALRGHRVTLVEKANKLGGRFNLACIAPFKQEYTLAIKWLSNQVKKLGVQVEVGKEATPELVEEIGPDAVIVATGAVSRTPGLPGMDRKEVAVAEDILAGKVNMGKNVAIIGGGGVGCDLADFMAQRGKQVTIIECLPEIGELTGIPMTVVTALIPRLLSHGVKMVTGASVTEITDEGVVVVRNGREETIGGFDQIITAMGAKPVNNLAGELQGKVPELYIIGDASQPRTALEATREGARVARAI